MHAEKLRQRQAEIELEERAFQRKNEQQLAFLGHLRELGVDLTTYLTSTNTKLDKVVKVEMGGGEMRNGCTVPPVVIKP